jgi:hypothetical protein
MPDSFGRKGFFPTTKPRCPQCQVNPETTQREDKLCDNCARVKEEHARAMRDRNKPSK